MTTGAVFAKLCAVSGDGLPYPEIPQSIERIVIDALHEAWNRLCAEHEAAMRDTDEDQTTVLLEAKLRGLLDNEEVAGFNNEIFSIGREAKVVNFNGEHPDKMPDLSFQLTRCKPGLRSDYALHIECKPVNAKKGMSPYYGRDGMGRFIHGDYGWAMRSGVMLAYAERDYSFDEKLLPKLQEFLKIGDDSLAISKLCVTQTPPESHHQRKWMYANGKSPGNIRLLHIWLTVP